MNDPDLEKTRLSSGNSPEAESISLDQLTRMANALKLAGFKIDRLSQIIENNPKWAREMFEWMEAQIRQQSSQQEVSQVRTSVRKVHQAVMPQVKPTVVEDPRNMEIDRLKTAIRSSGVMAGNIEQRVKNIIGTSLTLYDIRELIVTERMEFFGSSRASLFGIIANVKTYDHHPLEMTVTEQGKLAVIDFTGQIAAQLGL